MSERMLRGRAALTIVRGNSGAPGKHVYFSQLVDPRDVNPDDRDRLVAENYLEWVVLDGETWKLAEAGDSGDAGESVTVGSTALADPSADPGLVNAGTGSPTGDASGRDAEAEAEAKRQAAREQLPADGSAPAGNASHEVWVEYAVKRGYDRATVEKSSRNEIRDLFKA